MAAKTLLCLTALLLCVSALYARPRLGCQCLRFSAQDLGLSNVRKIEVFPVSGSCRRTEIRITRRNGRTVCADPNKEWVQQLLLKAQKQQLTQSLSTTSTHNMK